MVDGEHVLALATSQDHKRLQDGDQGPNTGGMGAYSPAPVVTPEIHARVMREIILPTVSGMAKDGIPYTGFLYAGLMIDAQGQVKTLEFNCRMGDPETQPIMMRLKSDLVTLAEHAVNGTLDKAEAEWDRRVALGVVLAAAGYPDSPRKGDVITDCRRPKRMRMYSTRERPWWTKMWSSAAGVYCVLPRWATAYAWPRRVLIRLPTKFILMAARCVVTSVTAQWTRRPANGADRCPAFQLRQRY